MKNITSFFVIGIAFHTLVTAQIAVSVGAGLGGSLIPPQEAYNYTDYVKYTSYQEAIRGFDAAFGTGMSTGLRFHYSLSQHVRIDMDASYYTGLTREEALDISANYQKSSIIKSPRLRLNPGINLSLGNKTFSPYTRLGVVIPTLFRMKYISSQLVNNVVEDIEIGIQGQMSLGYSAGVGFSYRMGSRFKLFYEISYLYRNAAIKKSMVRTFLRDSIDIISEFDSYQVETVYKNYLSIESNTPMNPDFDHSQPLHAKALKRDASTLTLNFGIVVNLN